MTRSDTRYGDNAEHLREELTRLDLRIRLCCLALPLLTASAPDTQIDRVSYISAPEVDWLLDQSGDGRAAHDSLCALRESIRALSQRIDRRVADSLAAGIALHLPELAAMFGLSDLETQTLLICLAPELRTKYDRLYAYLQDDITRRRPSVDLVLNLLCDDEDHRWSARAVFGGAAAMQRHELVQHVHDPHSPSGSSGLAQFLRLDPRITAFLLGDNAIDERLAGLARVHQPAPSPPPYMPQVETLQRLLSTSAAPPAGRPRLMVYLCGPASAGAADVAVTGCARQGLPVVAVDLEEVAALAPEEISAVVRAAGREATLRAGAGYFDHADVVLRNPYQPAARALRNLAAEPGAPLLLGGEGRWHAHHVSADARFETVEVPAPDGARRAALWHRHAGDPPNDPGWAEDLADRFILGEDEIRRAADDARHGNHTRPPAVEELAAACRRQINLDVESLAVGVEPRYHWADLVLPSAKIDALREICAQIRHRRLVYEQWGFGRKLAHGTGVTALFAGPPGTGKTMAAEVVAREVGLSLLKVDLSAVVSKYIGETEKNLARIFAVAQSTNAVVFFDEADALFGKRTEVSDAHDRYANIETSYLLQRLDEHDGMVLLATNLRANLDAAFTRRISYVVDFPFPDAAHRRRIWHSHLPPAAPIGDDLDLEWLATEFDVAGGSIKNIILNSAFLAADRGDPIGADHVLSGARREFEKLGKLWSPHPTNQGGRR